MMVTVFLDFSDGGYYAIFIESYMSDNSVVWHLRLMFTLACCFALMASDFSCYSPRKVTKRRPPLQLRPVKDTGFP